MSASFAEWAKQQLAALNVPVTRLVTDSRAVRSGDTFVAYPGEKLDGRQFIAQAIAQGANAVVYESHDFVWNDAWQMPNLPVTDLRHKAGWLADAAYGQPTQGLWMVGVTGTNGKTSTSHWIAQALNDAGRKCALIGTLGNGFAGDLQASANTTPDALRVHGLCAEYLKQGAAAVAMEVSSHALTQGRVNGVHFDAALLTNLSRDHLDYHGDMQSYAGSKRKLFDWQSLKYAVLNLDDEFGAELAAQLQDTTLEVVGYGLNPLSNFPPHAGERANEKSVKASSDRALRQAEQLGVRMVHGELREMSSRGMRIAIRSSWGVGELDSGLIGRFNAENLLGALAVLLVSGVAFDDALQSLSRVQPVAGRMQRLGAAGQPTVVVDYAHTPDALEKVLTTLREVNAGRLNCVFGCGGDRDKGKRAMMGLVAEKYADHSIVTSDNPRSEDPLAIIADILSGMSGTNHEFIADRAQAIAHAVAAAEPQDTILVAGKGHEDYQEINGVRHPFSDVQTALHALQRSHSGRIHSGGPT